MSPATRSQRIALSLLVVTGLFGLALLRSHVGGARPDAQEVVRVADLESEPPTFTESRRSGSGPTKRAIEVFHVRGLDSLVTARGDFPPGVGQLELFLANGDPDDRADGTEAPVASAPITLVLGETVHVVVGR